MDAKVTIFFRFSTENLVFPLKNSIFASANLIHKV